MRKSARALHPRRAAATMRSRALEVQKPISTQFRVDASRFDAKHVSFFDRFRINAGPAFFELHFGFYGLARDLQSGLIVVTSRQAIEEAKESLMGYVQQISSLPEPTELPACNLRGEVDVVTADIIGLARHGPSLAEITFHAFSWKSVVEQAREGAESITAICTALLRCDVELQKYWVLGLYEQEDSQNKAS
jgi:hypothetical protein